MFFVEPLYSTAEMEPYVLQGEMKGERKPEQ